MALQKQPLAINFAQGLDLKTDPFQVQPGKFLSLKNIVFDKGGQLKKRNGFGNLTALPNLDFSDVTTFNGNLTAIGETLAAYSEGSSSWIAKGTIRSLDLQVLPTVRSATNQTQCDSVVSSNDFVLTAYTDEAGGSISYKYVIEDVNTGQSIVEPTLIVPTSGTVTGSPRVFILGRYFIIVFNTLITATNHIQYIAINTGNPSLVNAAVNVSSQYSPIGTPSFDGYVANNKLYLAWNGTDGGGAVRITSINQALLQSNTVSFAGQVAEVISVTADISGNTPVVYVSYFNGTNGFVLAVNQNLNTVLAPTQFITGGSVVNMTSIATDGVVTEYYEIDNNYTYDSSIPTHYIKKNTVTEAGTVGSASVLVRSVGLASKAFSVNGINYFLSAYESDFQPTYFLINGFGEVVSKLAYENGGGYVLTGLPAALVVEDQVRIAYLFKDLIEAANKSQGVTSAAGVYSQTGINLATFTINNDTLNSAEIGKNLNLSGGFMWGYDGVTPTEQGFHVWPDDIKVTTATGSGGLIAQQYFYQAIYEWTDAQGNLFRSSPSVPKAITTTTGSSTNTIYVPTLRLTYKIDNPVKISLYRWSQAQQNYFQVTSITNPVLNNVSVDYVTITDALADSAILGNELIYTTGGVVENIPFPACVSPFLFDNRLFAVSAEDRNLILFTKQIIQGTPVEPSDLFSIYVSPTIGAQGSSGDLKCAAAMDDKAILFKQDAIYYFNGSGPDNTGANSQYSQPIFITSTVGCSNQKSIVMTPSGLMFESDKGIWILKRDLSTDYIGAPVQDDTISSHVKSAINIPGTNQVRFTLDSGVTLMYDYYYGQWGEFEGVPGTSSTLYQGMHTFINQYGQVLQETPDVYLDGANPVLISFITSWFNLSGIQGYLRAYFFYLLGVYKSPHKLNVQVAYDYNPSPIQSNLIAPDNYAPPYGVSSPYGQEPTYGGPGNIEQWRIHLTRQRCQSFQIIINEVFDASFGTAPGAGLTLSGINLIFSAKSGFFPISSSRSVGR